MRRKAFVVLLLTRMACSGEAGASDLDITMRLESDWRYHGFSEFRDTPAIGVSLDYQSTLPVFAGAVLVRTLDQPDVIRPTSNAFYVGAGAPLSDRLFATALVQRRTFPGAVGEWDYLEYEVELSIGGDADDRVTVRADYADDYYAVGTAARNIEIDYARALGDRLYGFAQAGAMRFSDTGVIPNYQYGHIGLGLRLSDWTFDVSWRWNSESDDTTIGVEAFQRSQWVARATWRAF